MAIELLLAVLTAFSLRRLSADAPRRQWALIGASAALIAYWQPFALLVAVLLTIATWWLVREQRRGRTRTGLIVAALLAMIALFRDAPAMSATWSGHPPPWPVTLGISFLVLRLVGVVLDAAALGIPVGLRSLVFLSLLFPTYRAGPITTLQSLRPLGDVDYVRAADRILAGLVRKRLLADYLQDIVVGPWMAAGAGGLSPEQCLLLPFALGLWVYWDFAGYSDIAIGTSALLGYRVPENFDHPYLSRNVAEFWRRWHITLSEWVRQRLFLKITGRRPSSARVYLAAIASMLAIGLWHGLRPGFVVWGLCHGIGVATVLALGSAERRAPALAAVLGRRSAAWIATGFTYVYVNLAWLPFFFPLDEAWRLAAKGLTALAHVRGPALLALFILFLYFSARGLAWLWARGVPAPVRGIAYALVLIAAFVFAASPQPFVYFRF